MRLPRTAYISLWFPKPSETFVVSEAKNLHEAGLPLTVHSLYGPIKAGLAMQPEGLPVERLGLANAPRIIWTFFASLCTRPVTTLSILARVLASPSGGPEKYGENLLALFCGIYLARRFKELGVEHVHAAWANGSATAAWCAARLLGITFSFSSRAGDVHPPEGLLGHKLRHASFALCESSFLVPHLRKYIPDTPEKVHLLHDVLTLPPTAEAEVPMRSPIRICAIGRFIETKGFQHLIEALALVRARGLEARVTLAGDGAWMRPLKALTARLNLGDAVRFPGFLPHSQVPALLLDSDILAMPSIRKPNGKSDGLPTVLIEALLHRVPVVATSIAGIPDLVVDGETGLLTPEGDVEALAQAIMRYASNRKDALTMAACGRERAKTMFAPERYAKTFFELLAVRKGGEGTGGAPAS